MLKSLAGEIQFFRNCLDTQVTSLPVQKDNIGLVCTELLSVKTVGNASINFLSSLLLCTMNS